MTNNPHTGYMSITVEQETGTETDSLVDRRNKDQAVICPLNDYCRKLLDYRTYCLDEKWFHYDDKAAQSVARLPQRVLAY